jgi:Uma2 family endonuclease
MPNELLEVRPGARNVISEAQGGWLRLMPLTVDQYHRMLESGILLEDTSVELLDGMLVPKDRGDVGGDPMGIGEEHAYVVNQLMRLNRHMEDEQNYVQTQQPVVIPEDGEPEPDAAIVLRPIETFGKPYAPEISSVIEIAGTSLRRDRTTKLRLYARGGISQYIIINLAERTAEEYVDPEPAAGRYAKQIVHAADATLRLSLADDSCLDAAVATLLPPPE